MSKKNNPWSWIPSIYIAEGIPYMIVMVVSTDLYKTMGVSNAKLAFWTSLLYLPWVIKPLWSPIVDLISTKRRWIVMLQLLIGISFVGIAFVIHLPYWFVWSLILLWIMALLSATQDISIDGFYMLALNENQQTFFSGIRSTFYRIAMIAASGLLVILTGIILEKTGLDPQKIEVSYNNQSRQITLNDESLKNGDLVKIENTFNDKKPEIIFNKKLFLLSNKGDSAEVMIKLSDFPIDQNELKVMFGQKKGSKDIYLSGTNEFIFTKDNFSYWQSAIIKLKPNIEEGATAVFDAKSGNIPLAWSISIGVLGLFFILISLFHKFVLPYPKTDVSKEKSESSNYWEVFKSFFRIKGIIPAIIFLLFYRFAESQLSKIASPFLLDSIENGGLGLSLTQKGFVYGTAGVIALVIGGILGGILASNHGLKKWIWWMAISINIPNLVYVYMAFLQPSDITTVSFMVGLEQFGYGFGFTAYMLFMLYLVRNSNYKTAHYALATGFMAMGMMIPGMFSGNIQEALGYPHFFIYVVLCTLPGFIALWFIYREIDPEFGVKAK